MIKAASLGKITRTLTFVPHKNKEGQEQHTSGAFRFDETDASGTRVLKGDLDGMTIGGLYVRRAATSGIQNPRHVKITIEIE